MSLVGPRPLLMSYLSRYDATQARRHDVLPGITGWAQIHGRNNLSWPEKFALDIWYVDHWSPLLDLRILALDSAARAAPLRDCQGRARDDARVHGECVVSVIVFGAGGHGKVVADVLSVSGGIEVLGFVDDDPARQGRVGPRQARLRRPAPGCASTLPSSPVSLALGIGSESSARALIAGRAREWGIDSR